MKSLPLHVTRYTLVFCALLFIVSPVFAQYSQYGGPISYGQLTINKEVRNPATGVYVDNLGLKDAHYVADNAVFFRITIQNNSNSYVSKVTVTDYLPPYVLYVSGGTYSPTTRQIALYFDNVLVGERRSTVLQVRVASLLQLPGAKSLLCPVNKVVATSAEVGSAEDTSQFCIEKAVMIAKVPQTGDPFGLLMGFGSLPMLLAGYKFGKKRV